MRRFLASPRQSVDCRDLVKRPVVLLNALKLHQGPLRLPTGNFQHVLHLATNLALSREFDVRVLVDVESHGPLSDRIHESRLIPTGVQGGSVIAADWATVKAVRRLAPDIYHRPAGQLPPRRLACRTVAGIADLSFLTLPHRPIKRLYKELSYRWTARWADRIICVSRFTRDEVVSRLGVSAERLRVIHHGTNPLPVPDFSLAESRVGPFFLVFAHQPHKNAAVCIRALADLRGVTPRPWMAVVGDNEYVTSTLKPLATHSGVAEAVVFVGAPTMAELAGLYDRAGALLFPSKFEGFGLPVLEAMSRGCPVVCSNVCSLPEVVGSAAFQLDPDDRTCLSAAMARLLRDREWREDLVVAGRRRASRFTWERAARMTEAVYRELV